MKPRLAAIFVLAAGLCFTLATAQEPAPVQGLDPEIEGTPPPAVAEDADAEVTLWSLVRAGGWAVYPLAVFSVTILALALYEFTALRSSSFCPRDTIEAINRQLRSRNPRQAIDAARGCNSYYGRMMARCLPYIDIEDDKTWGRALVHEAMGEFTSRANQGHMTSINYFSILAQASPMLGLLGTVSGMIKAFGTMGQEGMGDPTRLSAHISEALVSTAFGLIVALPALFCYFVFRNRLIQLVGRCVDAADDALDGGLEATRSGRGGSEASHAAP